MSRLGIWNLSDLALPPWNSFRDCTVILLVEALSRQSLTGSYVRKKWLTIRDSGIKFLYLQLWRLKSLGYLWMLYGRIELPLIFLYFKNRKNCPGELSKMKRVMHMGGSPEGHRRTITPKNVEQIMVYIHKLIICSMIFSPVVWLYRELKGGSFRDVNIFLGAGGGETF